MNKRLLTLIAIFALVLTAAGCAGIDGMPDGLPSMEISFTEVGNPDEDEAQLKGIYVNHEFDVVISYPVRFEMNEISSSQIIFSSDEGEELNYSFLWLEQRDTFESFIVDVRGGFDGLEEVIDPQFDEALCKETAPLSRNGMSTTECYYYRKTDDGSFVMIVTGMVKDDAEFETTSRLPSRASKSNDHSSESDEVPSAIDIPDGLHSTSVDDADGIPTVQDYPKGLRAVANEGSDTTTLKTHPLSSRELSAMKSSAMTRD